MKNSTFKLFLMAFLIAIVSVSNAQNVVDLTNSDNPYVLQDSLRVIPDGSIVLLKPGMTYLDSSSYSFNKSVEFRSSNPGSLDLPRIDCRYNYNLEEGATVDSIIFRNIGFDNGMDGFDNRYVFNIDKGGTIGKIMFESCKIRSLRGVCRMKGGEGTLGEYVVSNCLVDSINGYGVLYVDKDTWSAGDIHLENSSFSKIQYFLASRSNSNSLTIENCTLSEVPDNGRQMFRWRGGDGKNDITNGLKIYNSIIGQGWDYDNEDKHAIKGFEGLPNTTIDVQNTIVTSDFEYASDSIPGLPTAMYNGASAELWVHPGSVNFNYLDTAFTGIGNAGDPRWALSTADGGREWNISHPVYNMLGELDMTKTVAGLTIYAHSSKTVTIDDNNKSVDGMDFTNRLKLGGSGDFDDNGQPEGRVIAIDVMGNATITIMAMSSSSSSDRVLNIAAGTKDNIIAEFPAMGAELTKGEYFYQGGPTKLYFYSPSSGVNVYYIKAAPVQTNSRQIEVVKPNVNIYPNPADTRVYVDVIEPTTVGIYNIAGSLLISKRVESKNYPIDVTGLNQGMYLIRSMDSNLFSKKLIVR